MLTNSLIIPKIPQLALTNLQLFLKDMLQMVAFKGTTQNLE